VSGTTTKVRAMARKENLDMKKEKKNGCGARKKNGMKTMMNGKNQQGRRMKKQRSSRHHSLIKEESIP
jgi:hypothetical protein